MIDFYYTSGGPFAWRCLIALEAKQLPFTPHLLDVGKHEHKTPEMLALNPRGTLPVLKDGPVVVRESQAILTYLDRAYPTPQLFGRNAAQAARVMQEICEQASYVEGPLKAILGPLMFGQTDKLANVPAAAVNLNAELEKLDAQLAREPWLAGATLSAADINLYPFLPSLEHALRSPEAVQFQLKLTPISQVYPNIARWMQAIEALPGFERTKPVR